MLLHRTRILMCPPHDLSRQHTHTLCRYNSTARASQLGLIAAALPQLHEVRWRARATPYSTVPHRLGSAVPWCCLSLHNLGMLSQPTCALHGSCLRTAANGLGSDVLTSRRAGLCCFCTAAVQVSLGYFGAEESPDVDAAAPGWPGLPLRALDFDSNSGEFRLGPPSLDALGRLGSCLTQLALSGGVLVETTPTGGGWGAGRVCSISHACIGRMDSLLWRTAGLQAISYDGRHAMQNPVHHVLPKRKCCDVPPGTFKSGIRVCAGMCACVQACPRCCPG